MIRYEISEEALLLEVSKHAPTWLARAARRTDECRALNKFDGRAPIWCEIKQIYMKVQNNKCAYCEKKLEGEPYGLVEHDVEHYRPKNNVRHWPDAKIQTERKIRYRFSTGGSYDAGYYLLAFHPGNYASACKTCNAPLKANFFPIAGNRGQQSDSPTALVEEKPFLLYPLGESDDDPENVITFEGVVPKPVKKCGHRRLRARVTIDFFELDTREELIRARSEVIRNLWLALYVLSTNPHDEIKSFANQTVSQLQSSSSPHTNCARSFLSLHNRDPKQAEALAKAAMKFLDGIDTVTFRDGLE